MALTGWGFRQQKPLSTGATRELRRASFGTARPVAPASGEDLPCSVHLNTAAQPVIDVCIKNTTSRQKRRGQVRPRDAGAEFPR
jgi:hypothetical protein